MHLWKTAKDHFEAGAKKARRVADASERLGLINLRERHEANTNDTHCLSLYFPPDGNRWRVTAIPTATVLPAHVLVALRDIGVGLLKTAFRLG